MAGKRKAPVASWGEAGRAGGALKSINTPSIPQLPAELQETNHNLLKQMDAADKANDPDRWVELFLAWLSSVCEVEQ